MKRLPARLTISRTTGSKEGIRIMVVDEGNFIEVLELEMDFEGFAKALTGMGHVPCFAEWRGLEYIGKIRQHKTEFVPFQYDYGGAKRNESLAKKAILPFEKDGWKGSWRDCLNGHNRKTVDGVEGSNVSFVRYVDPEEVSRV